MWVIDSTQSTTRATYPTDGAHTRHMYKHSTSANAQGLSGLAQWEGIPSGSRLHCPRRWLEALPWVPPLVLHGNAKPSTRGTLTSVRCYSCFGRGRLRGSVARDGSGACRRPSSPRVLWVSCVAHRLVLGSATRCDVCVTGACRRPSSPRVSVPLLTT